jgi:hypothetical protein
MQHRHDDDPVVKNAFEEESDSEKMPKKHGSQKKGLFQDKYKEKNVDWDNE